MQKIKILIIEEDINRTKDIRKTLQKLGYSVISASSFGIETIKKVEKETPDLMLIGIDSKRGTSRIDATNQMLNHIDIPVMYLNPNADKKSFDAAKETRSFGYILYPFDEKQLYFSIEMALHMHRCDRELRKREKSLREFFNADTDASCLLDTKLKILEVNDSGLKNWGFEKKDLIGKNLMEFIPVSEKKRWKGLLDEVKKTGKPFSVYGIAAPPRFGHRFINAKFMKAGEGIGLIVTEITSQRRAEIALRESKERYKQLVEHINEGILMQDKNGIITYVNERFLEMIGFSEDEVLGHSITEYFGKEILKKNKSLKTSQWEPYELAWMKKDGDQVFALISPKPIYDAKNKLKGSVSVLTDISDRREVEQKLSRSREQLRKLSQYLQSVRERESKRIAREIHDELGQKLTALKMDLSWLSSRTPAKIEEGKKFLQKTKSMSKLIDDTIETVQKVSAELRPGLLDDLGLLPALEWLTQDFEERTNIQCRLRMNCDELALDSDLTTAIFRISQEALTNVARHAKATRVEIQFEKRVGSLELKIRDNGKGIKEEDMLSPTSLGLMGMRERLRPFNGKLEISGAPQKGTILTAVLPMKES